MTPAEIERLWRDCGLPEWFLGNGGTNTKLYEFSSRCAPRQAELEAALRSIAANTCCDGCQEAGKVARAALEQSQS